MGRGGKKGSVRSVVEGKRWSIRIDRGGLRGYEKRRKEEGGETRQDGKLKGQRISNGTAQWSCRI
jgi:hypothetical protein